jgi:hypothetical protein
MVATLAVMVVQVVALVQVRLVQEQRFKVSQVELPQALELMALVVVVVLVQ